MRIAFISYEYPPDTPLGGISTYVYQAARMLCRRGNDVEVFVASGHRGGETDEDGVLVHRVICDRDSYADLVGPAFAARHAVAPFDVLEGTDYRSDASEAVRLVPDIAYVLRLHTPKYLATAINRLALDPGVDRDATVRALQSGDRPPWRCDPKDPERLHALLADEIVAPSVAIGRQVGWDWGLDPSRISHVPNVFVPSEALLGLPIRTGSNTVLFLGRAEARKGVLDLAEAMPAIMHACPEARFLFVGNPMRSPMPDLNMQEYLEQRLGDLRKFVEFAGHVDPSRVPEALATAAVCVFPSYWENFSMACLEAMSAGRAIVASRSGGMAEMLGSGIAGRLIRPFAPDEIAAEVIGLLHSPEERTRLGMAARARIKAEYGIEHIAAIQEDSYCRAIARHRDRVRPHR